MEKPKYTPERAQQLQAVLEGMSPLELRWMHFAAEKELNRRVDDADRVRQETSDARFAYDLDWTADGQLKANKTAADMLAQYEQTTTFQGQDVAI
jgi:hypothetical protein